MPYHRTLNFTTFAAAISPAVLARFLDKHEWEKKPDAWATINGSALREFLDRPENASSTNVVDEQFRRFNDLSGSGTNLVTSAYKEFSIELDPKLSAEELAMLLFLDHPQAFEYAWSRYLLFGGAPKLSYYPIGLPGREVSPRKLAKFRRDLRNWFAGDAKGRCYVRKFDDSRDTVILISRGSYKRTVAYWRTDTAVDYQAYRPASEDILVYNHRTSQLVVKASLAKDRLHYLSAFATHIAGDSKLAESALGGKLYSLAPLQDESFDFAGDDTVSRVDLVKVRLRADGVEQPEIQIKSADVRRTVSRYLKVSLGAFTLTYARFRFHLQPVGARPAKVTFEIEPPLRTDLAEKKYADIIEQYLMDQKVKLA